LSSSSKRDGGLFLVEEEVGGLSELSGLAKPLRLSFFWDESLTCAAPIEETSKLKEFAP
jgi:hypothetical protein